MTKTCNKCRRELLATPEYFYRRNDSKDGFRNECKECMGSKFTVKRDVKEGCQKCIKCDKELPATLEYFPKNRGGIKTKCRACTNEYLRQYHARNREKANKVSKEYYENNKDRLNKQKKQWYKNNREKMLELAKENYKENSESIKEKVRVYKENNKEKIAETMSQWFKNNPDKVRLYRHRRKSRKKNLLSTLTPEQWTSIKKDFNNSCAYCGITEEEHLKIHNQLLHQEHFIPLAEGGNYTKYNIIPACQRCNSSKKDTDFFEWYPRVEYYNKDREIKILEHLGLNNNKQLSIL